MNSSLVLKFYQKALEEGKFNSEFLQELNSIKTETELRNFIGKKLRPIAKEMGYSFSTDELLAYEKNAMQKITIEDLESISGGVSLKSVVMSGGIFSLALLGLGNMGSMQADAMKPESSTQHEYEISTGSSSLWERATGILGSIRDSCKTLRDLNFNDELQAGFDDLEDEFEGNSSITTENNDGFGKTGNESIQLDNQTEDCDQNYANSSSSEIELFKTNIDLAQLPLSGTIDGINYEILDDLIELTGDKDNPIDIAEIPQSLRDLGRKFEIGDGIKSLTLQGNEEVDLTSATDLKDGTIGKIKYIISDKSIELIGNEDSPIDIAEIPQVLRDFGRKFEIGKGIKSLTLHGDEEIDPLSWDLEEVNVSQSNRYIASADKSVLYEKKGDGTPGKCSLIIKPGGTIGNIKYSIYGEAIALIGDENSHIDIAEIPQVLRDFGRKFKIRYEIKSLTLHGDEEIDISSASDLESIEAENSTKYITKNGHLYTKDQKTDLGWINKAALVEFSLDRLKEMPKDEESLKTFLTTLNEENLNENRTELITHEDASTETINVNERDIYAKIKETVDDLVLKVNRRTPALVYTEEEIEKKVIGGEYSKHYLKDKQIRIAKAIYRWVAKNISYDKESITEDKTDASGNPLELQKPQDALFVFKEKIGVCEGYARLACLMMRLAGIPSCELGTLSENDSRHSYNALYLSDDSNKYNGWTLIDATWGSPGSDADPAKFISSSPASEGIKTNAKSLKQLNGSEKSKLKEYFPLFYSEKTNNQSVANKQMLNHRSHIIDERTGVANNDKLEFKNINKGIKFTLYGSVNKPRILIEGDGQIVENLTLPENLTKYNLPFTIGKGIKSLTLHGDEEIRSTSWDLEEVDVSQSNRYIASADKSVLYKKNSDGMPGECAVIIKGEGTIGKLKYKVLNHSIMLTGDTNNPIDITEIPQALRDFDRKFKIGKGIKSLTLCGDEKVEITLSAKALEKIDTSNSTRYMADEDNIVLYAKTDSGEKGKCFFAIRKNGIIDDIKFKIYKDYIVLTGNDSNPIDIAEIPQVLRDLGKEFRIGAGIKSLTLQGDDKVNITYAKDLKSVDSSNSNQYTKLNINAKFFKKFVVEKFFAVMDKILSN